VRYIVGIDIGGTNIVVGTVAEDGSELVGLVSAPTISEQGAEAVIERIVKLARASVAEARGTPNLGWTNFPLRDRLGQALGLPATLDNDANCAIFGEWWRGAARGSDYVVGLTIGTGIGGGIVLGGTIYRGVSDVAGEIGHMSIDSNGRRCKCGNDGCLEAYASGPAIAARAVEGMGTGADTSLPRYVNGDLSKITAQIVYEAAHDGDQYALEVVHDTAKFLGTGVANIVNIFNPEVVVICGGVTLAGEKLFAPLRGEVKRRAFKPAVDACRIVPGELTGTAGVYGAAAVFVQRTLGTV